jgi:CIC family chloride channel protein
MALDLRIAVVKLIGGTIALGSGFFMGREGPTVQLGAAIAAPLTSWLPTTAQHKRQLIAAGAGAGLTAAFNAPLAGITFVMEELLRESKSTTILLAIVACSVSCFVLNLFGAPHIHPANDQLFAMTKFAPSDVPFYVLLGVVSGLAGAFFNASILSSLDFNRKFLRMPVTLRVGLAGLISGAIIAYLPDSFHNYAAMRNMIIDGQENWTVVSMAFIDFFLLTIIAYGSGAPGGLFAPALGLGSALGFLIGLLEVHCTGSGSTAAFALVGMGAFVSAVARTPLTAIVITFELTSNFVLLTPLMFTCVISSAVGDLVYKGGLYELLMRWNGIHLRGPETKDVLLNLKAKDVLKREVAAFSSKALVKDVLPVFSSSSQQGFVVIDKGKLVGVVTQTDLAKIKDNQSLGDMTIANIMTPHPVAIGSDDSLEEILFLFSRYHFTWLPVLDGDKLMGTIQQSDVLKALFKQEEEKKAAVVEAEEMPEVIESKTVLP